LEKGVADGFLDSFQWFLGTVGFWNVGRVYSGFAEWVS
jgi:hypothetical protein